MPKITIAKTITFVQSNVPVNCDYTIAVYNAGPGTLTFSNSLTNKFVNGSDFVTTEKYATIST